MCCGTQRLWDSLVEFHKIKSSMAYSKADMAVRPRGRYPELPIVGSRAI